MTTLKTPHATARYAVYFSPGESDPWWHAGCSWLGRCARTGLDRAQPIIDGVGADQLAVFTQAPRRYGWHATLKAPFALLAGQTLADLQLELSAVASQHRAFQLPRLKVAHMDGFLGLVIEGDDQPVQHIGAHCVTALHPFAAPLPPAEVVRRRGAGLSERQEQMLHTWGYPHVLDQFRFHMSLTGSLQAASAAEVGALQAGAMRHFESLPPVRFDSLSLFVETAPGAPFRWVSSHALQN